MGTKTSQADQESRYLMLFILALGIMCCACYQFFSLFVPECYESNSEPRTLISHENFEETWSLSDMFLLASDSAVFMAANEDHVVLYGINGRCGNPRLINLNADDGTIFHEGVKAMPSNLGITRTASNSNYFFLGYTGMGKVIDTSTVGVGGIAAYEINTGEIRWVRGITGAKIINSVIANDDIVSVDGFTSLYYLIDAKTGDVISSLDKFTSGLPRSGSVINMAYWYYYAINAPPLEQKTDMTNWYDYTTETPSLEQDPNIQEIAFWAERFDNVFQPPVLSDGVLIVRRGVGTSLGDVAALNGETGDLIWETEKNVVSNVVVDGAAAFFVTSQAELVALDVETGQKVGSIQFSNGETKFGDDRGYFVAASGGNVFVYLGDGRQLVAFYFLADE